MVRPGIDLPASIRCYLAGHLLLRGSLDTAMRLGERAIELARESNHSVSLCFALAFPASTLFLKLGESDKTTRHISELIDHATRHAHDPERQIGLCAQGSLAARRGDSALGIELLRSGLKGMREMGYQLFVPFFLAELAEIRAFAGQVEDSLMEAETALQLATETESLWFVPEAMRIKGEILSIHTPSAQAAAEDFFHQSIEQARRQQALYWELRAATSLAEFWRTRHRASEARELLAPIYGRFTEGFMALDLRRAKKLLEQLA
jgi:non-specific serine/threonine protein kinase